VVRINDRGPFVKGRIIDLSYTAARELGLDEYGTAPVRIEALGYAERSGRGSLAYRPPASYDRATFGIQVGAFGKLENAQRMATEMKKRYGSSSIVAALVAGARFYRVRAGNYPSLKEAVQAQKFTRDRVISGGFVVALD
jgi:rare lipoprotein A